MKWGMVVQFSWEIILDVRLLKGTIRIRMHDGIAQTLIEVHHVPNLKKNLISLGTLDSHGLRITVNGGVMSVTKVALVVMKGVRFRNLYLLQGSTVIENTAVCVSSTMDDDTYATLWHMRLGHISE